MGGKSRFLLILAVALGIAQFGILFVATSWVYTVGHLELARRQGVYASPDEGMRQLIDRGYRGIQKTEIYSSTNSFDGSDPHVWFVMAKVWAEQRSDGSSLGSSPDHFDAPGLFFLHEKDGWVFMPEGAFPEFIGYWMKIFHLAGG